MNNFLIETVRFLKNSDIRLYPLEKRPVKLEFENGKNTTMSVNLSLSDRFMDSAQISNNFILQIIVVFATLDAKIDLMYPDLEGQSFKYKYENLPQNSDEEIILRECYRIFKIFRNAATHSMESITLNNDRIRAEYSFKNTNFELSITQKGLSFLFTYIMDLFTSNHIYTQNHIKAFNCELFDLLQKEILSIKDEFEEGVLKISNAPRLKRWVRYYIENPSFNIKKEHTLKITSPYELSKIEKEYGVDYLVKLNENEVYLIPNEVLNDAYEIKISELRDWKLI